MQIQSPSSSCGRIARLLDAIEHRSIRLCLLLAPMLNFIIEALSRHSPFKAIVYLGEYPVPFFFNTLLILVTLLFSSLFSKRVFFLLFAVCTWLFGGVGNGILLSMRVTPFGFADFRNVEQAFDIVDIYMTPWQIALCAIAALLTVLLLVWMCIKAPRLHHNFKQGGAALLLAITVLCLFGGWAIDRGHLSEEFTNLADAYQKYGFCYCFAKSAFDQGVDRPEDYSDDAVLEVVEEVEEELDARPGSNLTATAQKPNIVMVQLESFFDVNRMKEIEFSSNPLPNFTRLMEENPSGLFTVPSIGAGTVNSEFEVLTGMSLDYFGTGEYPYKTILRSSTCPSLAYDLKAHGYSTYAIHNNNGTFYDRHKVYPNLGFDHFVSIEYMDNIRENALSWAKDGLLTQQILKCLDDAEQSGFVYTVAVQPHGRYPSEPTGESYPITASGLPSAEEKNQWEYYVGQMYETDSFIRDLTHALDDRGEPYICIFYGDHLPSLDILDDELASGNIYQTEYFIRSNMELPADDHDLSAYQLSARVLEMAGLEGNVLFSLHQTEAEEPDYQKNLELLEYDILYGEQEALDGKLPEPTDLQMGVDPITITKAYIKEDGLWVECKNLTWESYIFVNGKPYGETERRGSNLLFAAGDDIEPGDVVSVVQMGNDGEPLSYTNEILIN